MISHYLLKSLEKALNSYLALDPESPKRLEALEGKTIALELAPLKLHFQLLFSNKKIQVKASETETAEVKISGSPLSLLGLALSRDKKGRFSTEDLSIEGDAELGQQITELFDQLELDWEEPLSHLIGDTPTQALSHFTKGIMAWGKQAKESLLQTTQEYIHEEKLWFPPAEALEDFFREVDDLRLDLDRLEARIKNL